MSVVAGKRSPEETHARILQGALEAFSARGYSAATIRDISVRAGCNAVTVFRHFADKQTLFLQVVERFHALELDGEALQSRLSYTNVHADLSAMAGQFFELLFSHIHILRIFINDGPAFPQIAKYLWYLPAPCKHFVLEYLETMYPDTIPPRDAALLAELFVAYITRTCLRVNVQEGVEANSRAIAREARAAMEESVDLVLAMCMRHTQH